MRAGAFGGLTSRSFGPATFALGLLLLALVVARFATTDPNLGIGVTAVLALAVVMLCAPGLVLIAAFPATFAYRRIAAGGVDLSVTDATTTLAVIAALPFAPWRSAELRRILVALGGYLSLLVVVVLANPSTRALLEWPHRAVLFGGALIVGAAAAYHGRTAAALRAFAVAATAIAAVAVVDALASGFEPAYPLGLHKNAAGPLLAVGATLLLIAPERFALSRPATGLLRIVMLTGLAATQSRGAVLAFGAVFALNAVRRTSGRGRRASVLALLALSGLILVSITSLQDEAAEDNRFNPVGSREEDYDFAFNEVWAAHPIAGGGLKWFRATGDDSGPHNVFVAELSEGGIVGVGGLIVLLGTTGAVLWRRRDRLGRAAFTVFTFELIFALSGIFWLAGTLTLPMLVIGLAVGDKERERRHADGTVLAPRGR
jgi:hypothetical protein